jgi:hypothetical protein
MHSCTTHTMQKQASSGAREPAEPSAARRMYDQLIRANDVITHHEMMVTYDFELRSQQTADFYKWWYVCFVDCTSLEWNLGHVNSWCGALFGDVGELPHFHGEHHSDAS